MIDAPTLFDSGWSVAQAAKDLAAVVPMIGSTFGDDTPRVRRNDPLTSHFAADSNDVKGARAVVLAAFRERGHFADHELVKFLEATKYTPQRIRTARSELSKRGELELADYLTSTDSGSPARVWTLRKDAA